MTKRSRRRSRKRKRKTKKRRGGREVVAVPRRAGAALMRVASPKKVSEEFVKKVAKRIRIQGETEKSALERAKNLQIDAPPFEPKKWNSNKWLRNPHNCYTYALNKIDPKLTAECERIKCEMKNHLKPQPGYYAGYPRIKNKKRYNCGILVKRILADNPNLIYKRGDMRCDKGYYSGALTVHPKLTYHFYRQDNDGFWSHKDGATNAKRLDSDKKCILNPLKANRSYPNKLIQGQPANYKDFCGFFCIPKDKNKKFWQSMPNAYQDGGGIAPPTEPGSSSLMGLTSNDVDDILN